MIFLNLTNTIKLNSILSLNTLAIILKLKHYIPSEINNILKHCKLQTFEKSKCTATSLIQ